MAVQAAVRDFLARFVSRELEYHAELLRSLGYDFPREYNVGLRIQSFHFPHIRARIRCDGCSLVCNFRLADPSSRDAGSEFENFWVGLSRNVMGLILKFVEWHPEHWRVKSKDVEGLLKQDNTKLLARAKEAAKLATYTER